eukprot:9544748-Ditylum_brightwellii.AAC.1
MYWLHNKSNGLWYLPLPRVDGNILIKPISYKINAKQPIATYNNIYKLHAKKDLVQYFHAASFSPVLSTWCKAVCRGYFTTLPGLTEKLVQKNLHKSNATVKGHLNQARKNVRSTKPKAKIIHVNKDMLNNFDLTEVLTEHSNDHYIAMYNLNIKESSRTFANFTGKFPITSTSGNNDILVLYDYDSIAILSIAMKNRTVGEIIHAYNSLHAHLTDRGLTPKYQILDNDASAAVQVNLKKNKGFNFQLAPPHCHCRNVAERAIQTFKNHF